MRNAPHSLLRRLGLFSCVVLAPSAWSCSDGPSASTVAPSIVWLQHVEESNAAGLRTAVAPNNDVVLVASNEGRADFGSGEGIGAEAPAHNLVIARYSTDAAHLWSVAFTVPVAPGRMGLAIDAAGDLFVSVRLSADATFDTTSITGASEAHPGGAVLKIDGAGGALVWASGLSSVDHRVMPMDLTTDGTNVFVVGSSWALTDELGAALPEPGPERLSVTRLAVDDGSSTWQRHFTATGGFARGWRITMGAGNDLFVGGLFGGVLDLGANLTADAAIGASFVSKLDAGAGTALWAKTYEDRRPDTELSLSTDADGNPMVGREIPLDFSELPTPPTEPVYGLDIRKLDAGDGDTLWGPRLFGSAEVTDQISLSGLERDRAGRVLVVGTFQGEQLFGGRTLVSRDHSALFVGRLAKEDGAPVWSRYSEGSAPVIAADAGVDTDDRVVGTGTFLDTTAAEPQPHRIFMMKLAR